MYKTHNKGKVIFKKGREREREGGERKKSIQTKRQHTKALGGGESLPGQRANERKREGLVWQSMPLN